MLLKDLSIKNNLISADVVIKRDNKYYTVPLVMWFDNVIDKETMIHFINNAKAIDKNWKLVKETKNLHGKTIAEKPFKL